MKKLILLALTTLVVAGCGKGSRVTHKYEVLLATGDTMYVDAWKCAPHSGGFTSRKTIKFYDTHWQNFLTIYDPIYIREIK